MLIDNDLKRINPLKASLAESGIEVVAHVEDTINLEESCQTAKPDVVIIHTESPCRDTLDHVCMLSQDQGRPIVMFSHDDDKDKIRQATKAGVSAYVVGDIPSERLTPVIDAAIARFEETQSLRHELDVVNVKLQDRKVIEKAKGILMKKRGLDENEAYTLMRGMAMNRNLKLAEVASQLIEASKLLMI